MNPDGYIQTTITIPGLEQLMADVQEMKAKVDAIQQQLSEMSDRIDEDIQALKDKLDAAGIDQAVLDEVNAGLDQISDRVKAIDPDPANPAPPSP